jgi:hypothetical protein
VGVGVPFSCLACPDSFSTVLRASGPASRFCALGLIFGGTECADSLFQVLHSRTRFRRCRVRRVPFSCFALPDSFSAVPKASGPVFMFCAPVHIFDGTEDVGSRFHVLRFRTPFWRYRGRRVLFSYVVLLDTISTVPRASGPFFMFCAPRLLFGGIEGVGSRFHVLRVRTHFHVKRSRTHFWRYRGRRVTFSSFARQKSFGGTEGVRSGFHVLRSRTRFRRYSGRRVRFSCFASPDSFSAVPRASDPVSCFALPDSFLAVPRAPCPFFMFFAPGLIFGGTEGVLSCFNI